MTISNRIVKKTAGLLVGAALCFGGAALADDQGRYQTTYGQQQQQQQQFRGSVVQLKSVRLRGTQQSNLVAMIRTPDDRSLLVDLGPREDARQLGLQIGDQLTVRGTKIKVRGTPVLVANQARTGDQRIWIDRTEQRQHFRRAMERSHQQEMMREGRCPPAM